MAVRDSFDLTGRVAVITGGAGLLGVKHAEAIAEAGGVPVLLDIAADRAAEQASALAKKYGQPVHSLGADITVPEQVEQALAQVLEMAGRVDILINNAANNPKMESQDGKQWSRFENFPLGIWNQDIAIGLTGAFLCSQVFGCAMARQGSGVILNIASDLGVIAPDQRIYRQPGLPDEQQPVKPVTYSVVKAGLVGLTRYLSTYWVEQGVRANALSPGGVYNGQDDAFVQRLTNLIPMGRMADKDEYKAAIVFLVSDASAYMNGFNLVMDGGRTAW
ncbi:MAG: SDR family oxidoreductase [Anaerolineae bacterium]|nr:SDR family oxidoreductase [Anaerolineae bacterium]